MLVRQSDVPRYIPLSLNSSTPLPLTAPQARSCRCLPSARAPGESGAVVVRSECVGSVLVMRACVCVCVCVCALVVGCVPGCRPRCVCGWG